MDETNEILDAVDKLENYLSDELREDFGCSFTYETNGWWHGIKFMDMVLWSSENETRAWIETENKYEPLYPVVLSEFMRFARMIANLERINKINNLIK